MPDRSTVEAFAAFVEAGDYVGAIERFYARGASMRENMNAPRTGRDALIEHERHVMAAFENITARRLSPILIEGDQVAIRWRFTFTPARGPVRTLEEVAWQTWRDGNVVEEQFFYDPKQLAD